MYDGMETTDDAAKAEDTAGATQAGARIAIDRFDPKARREQERLEAELQAEIDAELAAFIAEERAELGLADTPQWREKVTGDFTAEQRAHTTILVSGLTQSHDQFITAAFRGLGYKVKALDCPDTDALRMGKEFGNRGQCNPTYFTVGNLVKTLIQMRDGGIPTETILDRYIFLTAGACGPCRFGSYITEYRKALRDAGFDGFRVILFQQTGGLNQVEEGVAEAGLKLDLSFFIRLVLSIMIGDVMNGLMYRIRPYEVEPGATDAAIDRCRALIIGALEKPDAPRHLPWALIKVRRELARVRVDRTRVKPKVGIIGEFWAMTTEGDGNYKMPRFLESEGAEVEVQFVTAWLLYMLWEVRWDTKRRMGLKGEDGGRWGLKDGNPRKTVAMVKAGDLAVRAIFQTLANTMGLGRYHLPDMDELAKVAEGLYLSESRGGEGHMEVAKVILNTLNNKVNMTLSIKPFGCMPSSGVSDGVQSVVTALHPKAIFLPIETTGDGAVNVYSRVQMMLFKAKQAAQREVDEQLAAAGMTADDVRTSIGKSAWRRRTLHKARHVAACTAADAVAELAARPKASAVMRRLLAAVAFG